MRFLEGYHISYPPPRDNEPLAQFHQELYRDTNPGSTPPYLEALLRPTRQQKYSSSIGISKPSAHVPPAPDPAAIICLTQTSPRGVRQARLYECCAFMGFATRGPHWLYTWMLPPELPPRSNHLPPRANYTHVGSLISTRLLGTLGPTAHLRRLSRNDR